VIKQRERDSGPITELSGEPTGSFGSNEIGADNGNDRLGDKWVKVEADEDNSCIVVQAEVIEL
jgi:hypothetical protein